MVQSKAQLENLKKGKDTQFNSETAARSGRKGAKKANETKRARRTLAEDIKIIFSKPMADGKSKDISELDYIDKEALEDANLTVQQKILVKMINESLKGNVRAYENLVKQIGESGADKLELSGELTVKDDPKEIKRIEQLLKDDPDFKKKFFNEGKP